MFLRLPYLQLFGTVSSSLGNICLGFATHPALPFIGKRHLLCVPWNMHTVLFCFCCGKSVCLVLFCCGEIFCYLCIHEIYYPLLIISDIPNKQAMRLKKHDILFGEWLNKLTSTSRGMHMVCTSFCFDIIRFYPYPWGIQICRYDRQSPGDATLGNMGKCITCIN